MGFFSKFENKMEDTFDTLGDKMFDAPITPFHIAKKAEKQMRRGKMVGAGKQYAPTLYTILVNPDDDSKLFGYYPTLAAETETYLSAKAAEAGLEMDGKPLVRFIVDSDLKHGKFDVIAEPVAGPIVEQLRDEEMERYGLAGVANQQNMEILQQADKNFQQHNAQDFQPQQGIENNQAQYQAQYQAQNEPAQPPVQQAPSPYPQSEPQPAPQPAPAPEPSFANQGNNQGNADLGSQDQSNNQPNNAYPSNAESNVPSSAAPTAVFAGGLNVSPNDDKIPTNNNIPPAHLRDASSGKIYTINVPTIVIGRENACNIVIPDVNISRKHAQILYENGV